jgi:hypothetical protein
MIVVNFGHPLTELQRRRIGELAGRPLQRVIDVTVHLAGGDVESQAAEIVDRAGLRAEEWESGGVVVNLPSLTLAAAGILAEVHGRSGHFPSVLRLRLTEGAVAEYDVAGIVNLQQLRDAARRRRI